MPKVIAVINLKGGVGKTTLTVALAEMLSAHHGKRVLVMDLDPQTNSTIMLIGQEKWKQLNKQDLTLAGLFRHEVEDRKGRFDLGACVQQQVGNVDTVTTVDMIPSSLDLIDLQDQIPPVSPASYRLKSAADVLWRSAGRVIEDYDYVLLDCPPALGTVTLNGLRIADGFLIPVIPDVLSTYGVKPILDKVREFSKRIERRIKPLGIVIGRYKSVSNLHNATLELLNEHSGFPPVLAPFIPDSVHIAEAANFHLKYTTLKQKYGYSGTAFDAFSGLTEQVLHITKG